MLKRVVILLILILVFIAGFFFNHLFHPLNVTTSKMEVKKEILYWVAPMDPSYRSDKPGKSPMGMDLVPVYKDADHASSEGVIKISPAVEHNLGVKTSQVEKRDLSRMINTVGSVLVDENNIEHIHTYTDGWIKTLSVKTTGEAVKKGQLLLELYSPALNHAQEELLLALKNNNTSLISAGEKKLLTLGMDQSQIKQLVKDKKVFERVKLYSTQNGIVSKLNIREGKFVKPDTDLLTIEDLSKIWIIADVFERQAGWVAKGQKAIATFSYMPGREWVGEVDYVYPELDSKTHTLRVRLSFDNPGLQMKPKMYANIKIFGDATKDSLAIPRSALIRTGSEDRVIISLGNGKFKAQKVKIGIESGDYYQVLSGLKVGDNVVTTSQFLIDSESNLKASMNRMLHEKNSKPSATADSKQ